MDVFIIVFDVETQEFVYINKNVVDVLSISVEDKIAGLVIGGVAPHKMYLNFFKGEELNNFMKAIEGKVYRIPECVVKTKAID